MATRIQNVQNGQKRAPFRLSPLCIDSIFALIRGKLANNIVMTPSELEAVIMSAFPLANLAARFPGSLNMPIARMIIRRTMPRMACLTNRWQISHIPSTRMAIMFSSVSKAADGNTSTRFKTYQQDAFVMIAFTSQDFLHVKPEDRPAAGVRLPCELIVKNGWEDATVLLGKPAHADLKLRRYPSSSGMRCSMTVSISSLVMQRMQLSGLSGRTGSVRDRAQWLTSKLGLWDRFRGSRGNGQSDPPSVLLLQLGRPRSARTQWSCSNQGRWHHLRMEEGRETRLESRVQTLALPLLWPRTLVGVP